ncbi:MAG: outer membrane protein assembly factor BamC [Candidatus Thiodiazotropha endolucinida]|uniref:Outer membrane protein assembly factor BamC n=1 Tax=Candidatus Thiodiazotropha taylori TaxID=2792791 RepID=A0A9E4TSG8_9GAMM|nr:outer membrane protein assembly factor BamC [Candidatus Thiodiazotropha taylori]MCW4235808.1 outer membrane protein assembly factor BamC [Candidatus Thiodiazotropha endolucinida]
MQSAFAFLIIISLAFTLTGCSSGGGYFSDSERVYRSQKETVDDLEVPPDLSRSSIQDAMAIPGAGASYEEYANKRGGGGGTAISAKDEVLPEYSDIRVERDGDQRWLVINAEAQDVWPKVVEFWRSHGLLLVEQDPTIGVMKTDWLESRADIKQGPITEFFRKTLGSIYSSATRDQFRVRLEKGFVHGTTELYLTHRGMEEKLKEDFSGNADTTYWTPRPNDPGIEAAMLRSIMVYLGMANENAEQALARGDEREKRSKLIKSGERSELWINEGFARAWRLTGVALDRVGFAVEDRDRSSGIYFVRYSELSGAGQEDKGFFSRLAFWRDDEDSIDKETQYQVKLSELDERTRVQIRDQDGAEADIKAAGRILTMIHEQIR